MKNALIISVSHGLMRFVGNHRRVMPKGIAYSLIDYFELVDCTGRCIREDKAGHIEHHHSPMLERLGLENEQLLTLPTEFEKHFSTAVGSEHMTQQFNTTQTIDEYEAWQRRERCCNTPDCRQNWLQHHPIAIGSSMLSEIYSESHIAQYLILLPQNPI